VVEDGADGRPEEHVGHHDVGDVLVAQRDLLGGGCG
jgi:hypothetical protein